ncbi:MAG: lysophospholipid acyltransferase family protein [Alphaproteobacteria bacterium]|nr:lysophospholipid acyltransferase family protein [Alphaproteobacteria bacterium]
MATPEFERGGVVNFLIDLPIRALFALFRLLPYRMGLRFAGFVAARILAPLFGINRRIRANLALVWPDYPTEKILPLCHEVTVNSARLMLESFNIRGFLRHARRSTLGGEGKEDLLNALANGTPVVLVSGHFGNYQALRVLLADLGHATAAIYRPMNNAFTNTRYIDNMNLIARPNFARGMKGTKGLLTHLRKGGAIALLNDQASYEGEVLEFLGKPALTMTSAAEFALKYQALLVPYYGIRQDNGVDFDVLIEPPIPHSDPVTMTQALNASLEKRVRENPGQWFWMHRRWKGV